jgi:ketosteroid isomerase-like protein
MTDGLPRLAATHFQQKENPPLRIGSYSIAYTSGMDSQNIQTIKEMYAAFGRGDINAILDTLSDDISWTVHGPPTVPFYGVRNGRQGVAGFFSAMDESCTMEEFAPQTFLADGDIVVCIGHMTTRCKATGKAAPTSFVHIFHFRDGKPCKLEELQDSFAVAQAYGS